MPAAQKLSQAAAKSRIAIYTVDQSAAGAGANPGDASKLMLEMFSELTGGRWYPSGNADNALAEAINDARGIYRLAYSSTVRENDLKERKIRVETIRKDVHLLTRQGYFSDEIESDSRKREEAAFSSARRLPFDATEIKLCVSMSRKPDTNTIHLDVRIDPADVLLERNGERLQGSLSLMFALYSEGFPKQASAPLHAT